MAYSIIWNDYIITICTKITGIGQLLLKLLLVVGWYSFLETQCTCIRQCYAELVAIVVLSIWHNNAQSEILVTEFMRFTSSYVKYYNNNHCIYKTYIQSMLYAYATRPENLKLSHAARNSCTNTQWNYCRDRCDERCREDRALYRPVQLQYIRRYANVNELCEDRARVLVS